LRKTFLEIDLRLGDKKKRKRTKGMHGIEPWHISFPRGVRKGGWKGEKERG